MASYDPHTIETDLLRSSGGKHTRLHASRWPARPACGGCPHTQVRPAQATQQLRWPARKHAVVTPSQYTRDALVSAATSTRGRGYGGQQTRA